MRGTDAAGRDAMLEAVSGMISERGAEPVDVQRG